jgi:hypothetical protein
VTSIARKKGKDKSRLLVVHIRKQHEEINIKYQHKKHQEKINIKFCCKERWTNTKQSKRITRLKNEINEYTFVELMIDYSRCYNSK